MFRNAMKKNLIPCFPNILLPDNLIFRFPLYPCALVPLWLKFNQSKITNYAKQSQFAKKSNAYNRSFYNELQLKMDNGHLVKTNPIQTQFPKHQIDYNRSIHKN